MYRKGTGLIYGEEFLEINAEAEEPFQQNGANLDSSQLRFSVKFASVSFWGKLGKCKKKKGEWVDDCTKVQKIAKINKQ